MRRLVHSVILLLSVSVTSVLTAPSSARWTKWGEWSACACSSETRQRTRQCTRGDSYCIGSNSERSHCEPQGCPEGKIIETDIVISPTDTFRSSPGDTDTWFTRRIPYVLDYSTRASDHKVWTNVRVAMSRIENEIPDCLNFTTRRQDDYDYINITSFSNDECYSSVGKRGGEQLMNIDVTCMSVGIIMHELLHALGFWHEQSRSDRNEHVTVIYENIIDNQKSQFDKRDDNKEMEMSIPYDYESIMHYKHDEFSKIDGQDTIVPTPTDKFDKLKLGQRYYLSENDKRRIQWLYKCGPYKINSCTNPTVIDVVVSSNTRSPYAVGSAVGYSCKPGKFLFGPSYAVCKDNGHWTGSIPVCFPTAQSYVVYLYTLDFESSWLDKLNRRWTNNGFKINSGQTQSKDTGPHTDNTFQFSTGNYAYLEASGKVKGYKVTLQSPKIKVKSRTAMCLLFFYNMYGKGMGSVSVKYCAHGFLCTSVMDTLSGSTPDNKWNSRRLKINTRQDKAFAIKFEATRGSSVESDIALDDILIASCKVVDKYYTSIQRVLELENNDIDNTKPWEYDDFNTGDENMKV